MAATFKIDGVDFSDVIAVGGLGWARHDLDGEEAGRPLSGTMQRDLIARKRELKLKSVDKVPEARARALANALAKEFVSVTYPDMQLGQTTKVFYGSSVDAAIWGSKGNNLYWTGISFTLVEK